MLCVLLGHALVVLLLMNLTAHEGRRAIAAPEDFVTRMFFFEDDEHPEPAAIPTPDMTPPSERPVAPALPADADEAPASQGEAGESTILGYVDWPKEGKEAAARVLAREAEAERVAKMFAGPQGTWASLTKRQKDELNHFRWKPGIDGLERDEKGNTIYRVSDGCALVNLTFIACSIGKKPPAYGDMFKDMRLYFDEQRRPATDEGNGREPESMRPPTWSKPLP
jgi:hypothetical protein